MIPRILHHVWLGDFPPDKLMRGWRDVHPDWEYRLWTDAEVNARRWTNQAQLDAMTQPAGRADILRYEILYEHGGIYIDADARCIRPLDEHFLEHDCWATFENETVCPGLITNAFLGTRPRHPLFKELIDKIPTRDMTAPAWDSVGPFFLTEVAKSYPELHVYPAGYFSPVHHSGVKAAFAGAPYAEHLWGSTNGYARIVYGQV